jgi:hypothetical protein
MAASPASNRLAIYLRDWSHNGAAEGFFCSFEFPD